MAGGVGGKTTFKLVVGNIDRRCWREDNVQWERPRASVDGTVYCGLRRSVPGTGKHGTGGGEINLHDPHSMEMRLDID